MIRKQESRRKPRVAFPSACAGQAGGRQILGPSQDAHFLCLSPGIQSDGSRQQPRKLGTACALGACWGGGWFSFPPHPQVNSGGRVGCYRGSGPIGWASARVWWEGKPREGRLGCPHAFAGHYGHIHTSPGPLGAVKNTMDSKDRWTLSAPISSLISPSRFSLYLLGWCQSVL